MLGSGVTQLGGLGSWLSSKLSGLFDGLIEAILQIVITPLSMIFYSLQMGFFYMIDCVQGIFRSMAGLSLYYYQGEAVQGDMVMSLLMDQTIVNIFWAVLVVAIMLLFVTTFVAIIRSEFTEKNAKGPIVGKAIKAVAYFAIVPISCLFGIWISNVFLKSFDQATSGQSYALSTTVFFAASHDGNRVRLGNNKIVDYIRGNDELRTALGIVDSDFANRERIAKKIDDAFLAKKSGARWDKGMSHMWLAKHLDFNASSYFDIYNFAIVYFYYDMFSGYNYMIGYMGGFIAASLLMSACIGLIQRMYELSILFVISPAFIAFMPLDDGAKYNGWKSQFIKRVGSMYGPVIGLNLMFIILAVLRDVNIFPNSGIYSTFNSIVQLIFLVVGLIAVKDFSSLISNLVGADDAASIGEGKKEKTKEMTKKAMVSQVAGAQLAKDTLKAGVHDARRAGSWISKKTGLMRTTDKDGNLTERGKRQAAKLGYRKDYYVDKDGNLQQKGLFKGRLRGSILADNKLTRKLGGGGGRADRYMLDQGLIASGHLGPDAQRLAAKKKENRDNGFWKQARMAATGDGNKTEIFDDTGVISQALFGGIGTHKNFADAAGKNMSIGARLRIHDTGDDNGDNRKAFKWGGSTKLGADAQAKKKDEAHKAAQQEQKNYEYVQDTKADYQAKHPGGDYTETYGIYNGASGGAGGAGSSGGAGGTGGRGAGMDLSALGGIIEEAIKNAFSKSGEGPAVNMNNVDADVNNQEEQVEDGFADFPEFQAMAEQASIRAQEEEQQNAPQEPEAPQTPDTVKLAEGSKVDINGEPSVRLNSDARVRVSNMDAAINEMKQLRGVMMDTKNSIQTINGIANDIKTIIMTFKKKNN